MRIKISWFLVLLVFLLPYSTSFASEVSTSEVIHAGLVITVPSTYTIDEGPNESYFNIHLNNSRGTFINWTSVPFEPLSSSLFEFFFSSAIAPIQESGFALGNPIYETINDTLYGITHGMSSDGYDLSLYCFHMANSVHMIGFCSPGKHTASDIDYFLNIILSIRTEEELIANANDALYEAQYKEKCKPYTYKSIARNPEKSRGSFAVVSGEVIQVIEQGLHVILRVNITQESWGYKDTIYITYSRKSDTEDRILEDDIVTVWGELAGMESYETIFGATTSIPKLDAEFIRIDSLE